jgi:hypothetical protein
MAMAASASLTAARNLVSHSGSISLDKMTAVITALPFAGWQGIDPTG